MAKLTEREVDFLERVSKYSRLRVADRSEDRVRQKMRRAGLVSFDRSVGKWVITPAGRTALQQESKPHE